MFENKKKQPIYQHKFPEVERMGKQIAPLMESAFSAEFARYNDRPELKAERLKFASEQFANRCRVAKAMNTTPLNEDARIFSELGDGSLKNLFESFAMPGNVIGMGEVVNADASNQHQGGIWNPAYKAGSGDIPSYVFGLQSHIALHCIGFDLMPTIAVDTPKVMINFVDTVYGGGTFDDAENLPSFIEVGAPLFTRQWLKQLGMKRATSKVVIADKDGNAVEMLFIVASTIKTAITVEVLSTGKMNAGTYTKDNSLTVKEVADGINAEAGAKVYMSVDGTTYDAGTNLPSVTLNYASATRTNIAEAASNNNSFGGMTRAQQEKGPKHKLNVISFDKQLEMVGLEIEADTSNIQIKDMAAQGINVIAHLYTGVQNQLVQSLDEVILDHLYRMGVEHAVNAYQSQGENWNLYIAAPSKTEKVFTDIDVDFRDMLKADVRSKMGAITNSIQSSGYENMNTHADRLYARILVAAEFVGQDNRIAPPDFLVAGGRLLACLKKNAQFSTCPHPTTLSNNPELNYTGTIFETISVYKNPRIDFSDPRILLGRRGNDTDPGSKFLAYDLAASRQIIAEGTMAEKIRVWSRFAIADVGFYPELNYLTFVAINEYGWN